ncbi:putative glycoside hydrolase [Cellvibrio sp. NN19]|uniref:putative glycoside hydrolase n=1 Tax=Cellvibrio chitinivorans TaxID=3102792 RepID=UPI002B41834B|nr:putative glycoside hydrolase [Cellvibrio sp. NN19]
MKKSLFRTLAMAPAIFLCSLPSISHAQNDNLNPNYFYLVKGELIQRSIALGDPSNWNINLQGRGGKSASGKLTVAPVDFQAKGDAIQLTWSKKQKVVGSFGLYGNAIDMSKFKDAASLTIDMRVDVKPDKDVRVGLNCGYPCQADIAINGMIKKMPKGEWFSLPIPLNCFKSDNFDLSKIAGPFTIATEGKFTVSITNVRLEKLPEGEKGCVEEK